MAGKGARILVADDEAEILRLLKVAMEAHGFHYSAASSGREALQKAAEQQPEVLILDMGLPDMDGLDVIREFRGWTDTPVIILSVREASEEKIAALEAGADDYVTKPFHVGELVARINVALRHRAGTGTEPLITVGGLVIDLARRLVSVDGRDVKLTPTEYELLKCLALNQGKVVTHTQLFRSGWGEGDHVDNQYLRVYVMQLRKKLEPDPSQPRYIHTEPGIGYRLLYEES